MKNYQELSLRELNSLERGKTIFLQSVSPLEVHGPHLPVGTDVIIAEYLLSRYADKLKEEYPAYQLVKLPPFYAGANPLPIKGSIPIKARTLEKLAYQYGAGLAEQGFKYLFLADNHGGPGHQLALEAAARKLWKRYRFYLINPFNLVFRYMVQHDEEFMEMTDLEVGKCGDDTDSHAGTNETSLLLFIQQQPERELKFNQEDIEPSNPPEIKGVSRLVKGLADVLYLFKSRELAADLSHLANTLAWVSDPEMKPYMGTPALACHEAGEAMLEARVNIAMGLFRQALAGEEVKIRPMLWGVRFLRFFT